MKCPVCNLELQMAVRSGIEIDYCPNCRGVWLDRGELDKIIERHALEIQGGRAASPAPQPPSTPYRSEPQRPAPPPRHEEDDEYYYDERHKRKRRKKRDWFEDLFDIFD
ncbi:MAG: hypothetical protein KatS3mg020_0025 [Fimbriimonadales bacterium]|nr:MAG: hypothetical protein KatS3mg020_0025 [Fimbriimonadales bacterium]